jgi:MFS transporter, SP family, sugar:H+ symporter
MVNVGSTIVSIVTVDRYGHRPLFVTGGVVMVTCQVAVAAWIMRSQIGGDGGSAMARRYPIAVLALMCVFSALFGWSADVAHPRRDIPGVGGTWHQRGSQPGHHLCAHADVSLHALRLQVRHLYLLRAAWVGIMAAFVVVAFLPETNGVPLELEAMGDFWARHWYWGRLVQQTNKNAEDP